MSRQLLKAVETIHSFGMEVIYHFTYKSGAFEHYFETLGSC
jgi:hypothetical protein